MTTTEATPETILANARDTAIALLDNGKHDEAVRVLTEAKGLVGGGAYQGTPIAEATARTLARIAERKAGRHGAVSSPFRLLNEILGGGFEPGIHVLVGGTGVGKSTLAVACAIEAAINGHAVGYVSLELELEQITARMMAELHNRDRSSGARRVFFSDVMRGGGGVDLEARAKELARLPIVIDAYSPLGWQATKLRAIAEQARPLGAADKTPLVVLDYLQLVGEEEDVTRPDVRARIGRAAAVAHGIASELRAAVLVVSSVARSYYPLLAGQSKKLKEAGVKIRVGSDERGQEANGYALSGEDGLVGLGKESGEIEYSATSVLAMVKGGAIKTPKGEYRGQRVALAVAKSRMGRTAWCPLRFSFGTLEDGDVSDAKLIEARFVIDNPDPPAGGKKGEEKPKPDGKGVM